MNYKMMGRFIGHILLVEAVFMTVPLAISLAQKERMAAIGFAASFGIILVLALLLSILCKGSKKGFRAREGLVCVGVSWIVMSLLGSLPFYISREIPSYLDALFETVSGFTTTGASILPEVEILSKGILYWRSFTHWLGGMGVLVFVLAVGAFGESSKGFTMHLLRAESPGPQVGKLVPKMKKTAEILYLIYMMLTIVNIIFLLAGGMPLFDSVCTAFGTAGTGGFGIKNDSIASYSPYIQNVCTVFMLLFGVNFSCYYMLLLRQFYSVFKDEELRLYLGIVLGSIVLITLNVRGFYGTLEETVRHAAFQVASIVTTTGFATTDFDLWPSFSKAIILGLMVIGASAGSTGGGFKCARVLIVVRSLRRNLRRAILPQKVQVVRINNHMIDEKVLENTNAYLTAYVIILFVSFILVSIDQFSITTNITAVLSCFNNIGPGLEAVGPTCNFGDFSWLSKLVLIMDMLAGRLEIFPILILFSRSTWGRLKS
ncbi:MAG: TrkH family potassium uptake protein [Lachnospiraceae bacterium]|jgi:trk system potassium uptake protein TrkH|nr:TrkH family potassium uptake protein [Lachnospiraceae bacterium]